MNNHGANDLTLKNISHEALETLLANDINKAISPEVVLNMLS